MLVNFASGLYYGLTDVDPDRNTAAAKIAISRKNIFLI